MAKLSARGRTELVRVRRVLERGDLFGSTPGSPGKPGTVRTERALSDGNILAKRTWYFADDSKDFDSGWKVNGRLKVPATPDVVQRWATKHTDAGWKKA